MNFSIMKYVKTLIPVLNKRDIINDIARVRRQLEDGLVRNYELAADLFYKSGIRSPEVKPKNELFLRKFSKKHYPNLIDGIYSILLTIQANCPEIERIALNTLKGDVSSSALSYLKANVVRYIELLDFATRYANGFVSVVLFYEARKNGVRTYNNPTKRDFAFIEKNFNNFIAAMEVLSIEKGELERSLSSIPDVVIPEDETAAAVVENAMEHGGDPLNMRFILDTSTFNIPYHVSNMWNNYLQNRYDRDIETRKMVELKIEDYRRAEEGSPDPKRQAIIEEYEKRLALIEARIKSEEEKYANT